MAIRGITIGAAAIAAMLAGCQSGATTPHAETTRPASNAAASPLRVTTLKCEFAVDPAGVDVARPRLFWRVEGDGRGRRQTAYRVLVASSSELLAQGRGDLWDSGRVESDQTTFVRYGGAPLASSLRVYWTVRAWDENGVETSSSPATWTMGLLASGDWRGEWIGGETKPTQTLALRRGFTVAPGLKRAVAHVTGLGQYELSLNGRTVGEDLLTPGWTDYRKTIAYDTRDVTSLLREGPNAAGILLGDGMYNVVRVPGRFAKFVGSQGPIRAILHLRLEYADGRVEYVGTDDQWRAGPGPATWAGIYGGEDWDARRLPAGWDAPGFDDSAWPRAKPLGAADEKLAGLSASAEPIRVIETRQPVKVQTFDDGTIVYDFGQNASFMPRLRVTGPAGSTVRLTPSEMVDAEGRLFRQTMGGQSRGANWWQYTKATDGPEEYVPRFFYLGSRYVRAEFASPGVELPYPIIPPATGPAAEAAAAKLAADNDRSKWPRVESIEQRIVHASAAPVGKFACSDELLNRIHGLIRWAQRSNMMSVLTDCPHREKLGWLEQTHTNGPSIRYEFDLARVFATMTRAMRDSQLENGLVPNVVPEYVEFKGTFRAAAEWGAAFILVPWQQYQFTGDVDLLRENYDAMTRYFAYLESKAKDDILDEGLGDWYDLGPNKPGKSQLTPPPPTATAFFHEDALTLSKIADVLGKPDDATKYRARAAAIRAAYNKAFFDAEKGTFATGSQGANGIALGMYLAEEKDRPRVLDALVKTIEANDHGVTAGEVSYGFVNRALADGGRGDVILKMLRQDVKPGYAFQLKKGETTLTEAWNANDGSSHNHFMFGQIIEWFYRDLVGIDLDPAAPGFKKIVIRPTPVDGITWAEASYESIHGPIAARWDHEGDRFTLAITVPANTIATVAVPSRPESSVLEGDADAAKAAGVTFLRRDGDRAVYAVTSGRYTFRSTP